MTLKAASETIAVAEIGELRSRSVLRIMVCRSKSRAPFRRVIFGEALLRRNSPGSCNVRQSMPA